MATINSFLQTRSEFIYTAWVEIFLYGGHESTEGLLGIAFVFKSIVREEVAEMYRKVVVGGQGA